MISRQETRRSMFLNFFEGVSKGPGKLDLPRKARRKIAKAKMKSTWRNLYAGRKKS